MTFSSYLISGIVILSVTFNQTYAYPRKNPSSRIVGGVNATVPYQAALETTYDFGEVKFCGGSLIKPNVVLTTATCVGDASGATKVTLGAFELEADEPTQVTYSTKNRIVHKLFDNQDDLYDIALVILPENAPLNDYINTVDLPTDPNELYENADAYISGWGRFADSAEYPDRSTFLQGAEVYVLPNFMCELFIYPGTVNETELCISGSEEKNICEGDEGGPLVVDGVQVGIASQHYTACEYGFPSVFTRVTSFIDWINENLETYARE